MWLRGQLGYRIFGKVSPHDGGALRAARVICRHSLRRAAGRAQAVIPFLWSHEMKRTRRGRMIAAALLILAAAGCRTEPTGIDPFAGPAFDGGVGTVGSGNKADTTTVPTTATQDAGGVGTVGSGN